MTTRSDETEAARLARKAVVARSYTDPLGAKGFRKPFERLERERRARRLTAFAALASFAGLFGLFVATSADDAPSTVQSTIAAPSTSQIIAEIPVPAANPGDPPTLVRILVPNEPQAPVIRSHQS